MRLEKFLSDATNLSRSEIKKLIASKRVLVNSQMVTKTQQVTANDTICIDNEIIKYRKFFYYMLNKPQGYVCANEDNFQSTIFDLTSLDNKKFFSYGRLDKDTEGLIIISNDGQLGHNLLSPKKHVNKKYFVQTEKQVSQEYISVFENGVTIEENFKAKPAKLEIINENECLLTISEGKFHQVKRMFEAVGNKVTYLKRLSFGNLQLDKNLELGQWRELTENEINILKNS
ncbi:pseudouridine synthase [Mycoplasma sp. 128]|uniref:pseudouridine synthase n=1 Tax=Mycoplasma sp. 3341 TaxID=3447506 RepID=UPI003F6602FC